ncbi:MAG: hypothetical protein ABL958_10585 [Bdellovibrionia bacterium]
MRLIVLLASLSCSISLASNFSGPTSTAIGGAGTAGVNILEASHRNPATLPHVVGYHFGFLYNSGSARGEATAPETSVSDFGIVLTDVSEEVLVPAALSYVKGTTVVNGVETNESEIHVGAGFRVVKFLTAGFSIERLTQSQLNGPEMLDHNATAGLLFTPRFNIGLSLVFRDMLNTRNIEMNPTTTVGVLWMFDTFLKVYLDLSQPQKSNPSRREIVAIGVESTPVGREVMVRTGGRWDQYIGKRYMTAGLGWDGPNLSVDWGYEKNLDFDEYRHLVDMRVQF